jgi:hypothetical protein
MRAGSLMPGMNPAAAGVTTASSAMEQPANAAEDPAAACGGHGAGNSCGGPWATGPCASMSACAWSQSATVPAVFGAPNCETTVNHPEPLTLRAGPVVAPELPPPRV